MFSMTNYYYIVASLPAISQDWKFGDRTARGLMDEIKGQSTAKDLALIEFVEAHKLTILKRPHIYIDMLSRPRGKKFPKLLARMMGFNRVKFD